MAKGCVFFTDSSMNIGGQELQALQQMRALNQAGWQTQLLCKPQSMIAKRAIDMGLAVHVIRFRNAFHVPSWIALYRIIKNRKPNAIICHGSHDAILCALLALWMRAVHAKCIPVFRIKTFQHGYPLSFAYNYLFTKTLTPSAHLRSLFLVNKAIDPKRIDVLYPGIDFAKLANTQHPLPQHIAAWLNTHPGPVIAHGAILRGEKGHSVLLHALAIVKKIQPQIRYLIAGQGQEKPVLEALIHELGLDDNVLLTGIVEHIAPLLRASDIAVLPSLIEPLGMFQIEAQFLEVPTITSDAGGIPETIVHEQTGLMVEAGNVAQWAKAILWMLDHPLEAKQFAKAGKQQVLEKFSLEANTAQLLRLIGE
jgi:glycosyltransferase involved in cell wall biosynthesis